MQNQIVLFKNQIVLCKFKSHKMSASTIEFVFEL